MMPFRCRPGIALALLLAAATAARWPAAATADPPAVSLPPEAFFELVPQKHRDAARAFYRKYLDSGGIPVAAAGEVHDVALERTHEIVRHMLAGRPDIRQAMIDDRMYLVIIGRNQLYTDMPEYSDHPNPTFQNERVRGTGGRPTSFGEENLLSLPIDRYDDESIAVHEFCHTIDSALRSIDPDWTARRNAAFQNARRKGLYEHTYAASNPAEYWAEIAQAYFDCNRVNNWNHGPVGTREQLKIYDPTGYELVRSTFNLSPDQDWRYSFVQRLPNVTAPPDSFRIDPYYTKFSWAREFTVLGRQSSDEAILQANHTIRRMFAYRHDVLKALIADGVKLVVLGRTEQLAELPELRSPSLPKDLDLLARTVEYRPDIKILAVGEENVLADPRDPGAGDCQVIRLLADAMYRVAGTRPVDPAWDDRSRGIWQQYELRVRRLDERFDARLNEIYERAIGVGKWRGTASVHGRAAYWSRGVLAYFDAAGQDAAPLDAIHPIRTREALRAYDPELHTLVHETFGFERKVDWRYGQVGLSSDAHHTVAQQYLNELAELSDRLERLVSRSDANQRKLLEWIHIERIKQSGGTVEVERGKRFR